MYGRNGCRYCLLTDRSPTRNTIPDVGPPWRGGDAQYRAPAWEARSPTFSQRCWYPFASVYMTARSHLTQVVLQRVSSASQSVREMLAANDRRKARDGAARQLNVVAAELGVAPVAVRAAAGTVWRDTTPCCGASFVRGSSAKQPSTMQSIGAPPSRSRATVTSQGASISIVISVGMGCLQAGWTVRQQTHGCFAE